jgi:hypothetical protein
VKKLPRTEQELLMLCDTDDATGELETRRNELAKRLAAKQAEKDRYVRL